MTFNFKNDSDNICRNLSIQHGFGQLKIEWNLTISCWELINLGVVGIKICPKPCKVCPKPIYSDSDKCCRNLSIPHGFGQLKNEWNLTISCWELINLGGVGIKICPKPCKVCPKPWNTWKWPVFQLQLTQNQWKSFCKYAQNRGTLPKTVEHVKKGLISIVNKINQWNITLKICPKPWDFAQMRGTR